MLHNLLKGITTYFTAVELLFSTRLRWFILIPLVFQLILILSGADLATQFGNEIREVVSEWITNSGWGLFQFETIQYFILTASSIIFRTLFFLFFIYIGGYILLIVMSPVLAWVSEEAERIINNKEYPFSWKQFGLDIWRGIKLSMRNVSIQTALTIALVFVSLIPFLGWVVAFISPFILFFISSYFFGFSFMDYTCERYRLSTKQSCEFVKENNGFALANGSVYTLCLALPFAGVFLAGFMAIISTVAATIGVTEIIEKEGLPD
jgi:CysZ protein